MYAIKCPECNMLIKRVNSLDDIPKESIVCYSCENEIRITIEDIKKLDKK